MVDPAWQPASEVFLLMTPAVSSPPRLHGSITDYRPST